MQKTCQILTCSLCNSNAISLKSKESEATSIIKCNSCNNEAFITRFKINSIDLDATLVDLLIDSTLILSPELSEKNDYLVSVNKELVCIVNTNCKCPKHLVIPKIYGTVADGYSTIKVIFCCDGVSKRHFLINVMPFLKKHKDRITINFLFEIK